MKSIYFAIFAALLIAFAAPSLQAGADNASRTVSEEKVDDALAYLKWNFKMSSAFAWKQSPQHFPRARWADIVMLHETLVEYNDHDPSDDEILAIWKELKVAGHVGKDSDTMTDDEEGAIIDAFGALKLESVHGALCEEIAMSTLPKMYGVMAATEAIDADARVTFLCTPIPCPSEGAITAAERFMFKLCTYADGNPVGVKVYINPHRYAVKQYYKDEELREARNTHVAKMTDRFKVFVESGTVEFIDRYWSAIPYTPSVLCYVDGEFLSIHNMAAADQAPAEYFKYVNKALNGEEGDDES